MFASWAKQLGEVYVARGMTQEDADSFASFTVSALEGAIVQARAGRTLQPLNDALRHLKQLLPAIGQ